MRAVVPIRRQLHIWQTAVAFNDKTSEASKERFQSLRVNHIQRTTRSIGGDVISVAKTKADTGEMSKQNKNVRDQN